MVIRVMPDMAGGYPDNTVRSVPQPPAPMPSKCRTGRSNSSKRNARSRRPACDVDISDLDHRCAAVSLWALRLWPRLVLECAATSGSLLILSDDHHLLSMSPWRGAPVVTSGDFVKRADATRRGRRRW